MPTFSLPTELQIGASNIRWGLQSNTLVNVSPLSGQVQTVELPGARWTCELGYSVLTEAEAAVMRSLLVRMRGQANRLLLWDFANPTPRGTQRGTPLVNGANQTGSTLNIDAVTNGNTFLRGDMLSVQIGSPARPHLFMVVADVTAAAGAMSLTIEPPLPSAPADNAVITWDRPAAQFVLTDPAVAWDYLPARQVTNLRLQFVEVFE